MRDRDERFDSNFALIATGIVLVMVYGSLYPFHYRGSSDANGPLRALIDTWRGPFGRGDFLANVLFYVPVGLFAVQALNRLPPIARIAVVSFFGLALSISMELLQFYDEGRVSALADVYADTIGVTLGSAASEILFRLARPLRPGTMDRRPFVLLLLSCWLGYRLFPFVPVIDLHKYWTAVKPLLFSPSMPPLDLYRHTVIWLSVALLIEALVGSARSRVILPLLLFSVLFARILIVDAALSPAEVGGGALAVLGWQLFLSRAARRAPIIAAAFAGGVVLEALRPFQFSATARPFEWIPFSGFMRGSVEINIRSFFEKTYTYGALVWLAVRAGLSGWIAVGLSSGLVLSLRLSQVFLPGRSAEITDLILVLLMAGVMRAMREDPTRVMQTQPGDKSWRDVACAGFYRTLTRDDLVKPVDLILVLAGRMERKRYGLELYRAGVAPRLILSVGRFEVSKMSRLDLDCSDKLKLLRDETPPGERHFFMRMDVSGVHIEKASLQRHSTYGEALAFRRLLHSDDARKVMIVSTDIHLQRVALTYGQVFRGTTVQFLYCPVSSRHGLMAKETWWKRPADRWFVISEMTKLAGYRTALLAPEWISRRLMQLTGWGRT